MMIILGIFTFSVADQDRKLIPTELVSQFRAETAIWFISGGLYLVTVLPFFFTFEVDGTRLRYLFWAVPLLFVMAARAYQRISTRMRDRREGIRPQ